MIARKAAEPGGFTTFRRKKPKPSKRSFDPVTTETYQAVFHRDGDCLLNGSTEPGFNVPCSGVHQWAHRKPVAWGGPSTPDNGTRLCAKHHARVDGVYRPEARRLGLFLRRSDEPATTAVMLATGNWVLLTGDGHYKEWE